MLRFFDITEEAPTYINFKTTELTEKDLVPYIVFDTSTGTLVNTMDDYAFWRSVTITSTGSAYFQINNSNLHPSYQTVIANYTLLKPALIKIMTYQELTVLQHLLTRLDLVRRRLPNPGFSVNTQNSVGQDGTVSFAGGYEKKFSVVELMQMIEGSILELNWTSPETFFYPMYVSDAAERNQSPYNTNFGMPNSMLDLVVQGAVLRALVAWGIMEIDLTFSSSDSGLQISFDRVSHTKGWRDSLLAEYQQQKKLFKMNFINSGGVGVGTYPFSAFGNVLGVGWNNVQYGGAMSMASITGWSIRGNVGL